MQKLLFQRVGQRPKALAGRIGLFVLMLSGRSQKYGSFKKDEEILKSLIEQASTPRERQRLNRLQCEHSGAWICAVPSTQDGNDTVRPPFELLSA